MWNQKQIVMKNKPIRISFDFDSTMTKPSVQKFATQMVNQGHEVWICTSRFSDNFSRWGNSDLYQVAEVVGISIDRIKFMNMADKYEFFIDNDFLFHLDDDSVEIELINENTDTVGINVFGNKTWKRKCNVLLKKEREKRENN